MISKFRQEKKGGKNTRALARQGGHVTRGERGKFRASVFILLCV